MPTGDQQHISDERIVRLSTREFWALRNPFATGCHVSPREIALFGINSVSLRVNHTLVKSSQRGQNDFDFISWRPGVRILRDEDSNWLFEFADFLVFWRL